MRTLLCLLFVWTFGASAQAQELPQPLAPAVEQALAIAAKRRVATLVEFRAPWCYSCYYMARHVHTGAEWAALKRRAVVVELDADSPEGAAQMKAWKLKPLPAYVVLDADGHEIGRLLGEHRRADFYRQLDTLLQPGASLDAFRTLAARGDAQGERAAHAALRALHARNDADAGLRWFYDLPGPARRAYEKRAGMQQMLARLRLMQAAQQGDAARCTEFASAVFASNPDCERPQDVARYRACLGDAAMSDTLLNTQRESLAKLIDQRVMVNTESCADARSAVMTLADLHAQSGDASARRALLERAASHTRERLGADVGSDRNLADNLRFYVETLGDWDAYDALLPQLVAAWPDDYVYAYRYGRNLLERDRASQALPYLERAARRAYGQNRLKVAELRVKALKRLGEHAEARQVAAEALQANGPWFPELVAAIQAQL